MICSTKTYAFTVPSGYQVQNVVTNLSSPVAIAFIDNDEFFFLLQSGVVNHVTLPGPVVTNALTLTVTQMNERGLLGIALHPDFVNNGWVYLYYTKASPLQNRIERYTWNGTSLISPVLIATFTSSTSVHNGGFMRFGPDGKLYVAVGDQDHNEATENFSDTVPSDTGIILRLNDDGSAPRDNPFIETGWEKFFAYGVRNCYGLVFDPLTNSLWDTENAPGSYDEINRVVPGMNSGWERIMGPVARDAQGVTDLVMVSGATYSDPAFSWFLNAAPTGIMFLDSCRWPASLRNDCFVSCHIHGDLYRFDLNESRTGFVLSGGLADKVADTLLEQNLALWGDGLGQMTALQLGPDGYMYVVRRNPSSIVRIRPINPMGDINLDGNVTLDDVPLFVSVLLGDLTNPAQIAVADFDGDGIPTGLDIPDFTKSLQMPN